MSTTTLGGHVHAMPNQPVGSGRRRRNHSDEFKARAVACCSQPGMSMAAVAMAHGVNANLLRRWVREAETKPSTQPVAALTARSIRAPESKAVFVPVGLPAPTLAAAAADIRVELQRGAMALTVTWPSSSASECAAWLRELVR